VSKKAWIIFAAVCVIVLGGLVYFSNQNKIDVSSVDANAIQTPNAQSGNIGEHVSGKADSKVMLVEYGDYQCPGCGAAYQPIKDVTDKYKGQIAFVFRNFPLTSLHPNARAAAAAAEAAGLQGKYWEMHDQLYEGQSNWENLSSNDRTAFFTDYAKSLGLDANKFTTDLTANAVNQKIGYDIAIGKKIGVNATPTFYLNGKKPDNINNDQGGIDEDKLSDAIDALLKENNIPLPAETK
jgi:protein-disulfide isomerase